MPESRYIHGTAPKEQARLTQLNALLNAACLRELAVRPGDRVLDLGAGLGQLTREMARAAGRPVVGVERSAEQIAEALRQAEAAAEAELLDLRQGDAATPPLAGEELGTFDLAHTRFLLEHVRDPLAVVRAMVAAVRPGGRVVLADDDHDLLKLSPEPPGFHAVWEAFERSYDRLGNDPYVGRRLPQLLQAAGARPLRITLVFFGACAGEATFPAFVANVDQVLRGATEAIREVGIGPDQLEEALAGFAAFARRPDAAIWYAMSWAEGRVP
ncbi:MAG TPA: methyltransferase domain-containing protein [Anaeromyxobacter sp.]|nr:methyltransferase domain-containing protein [Anaeromyxobacter sp.]